MKNAIAAILCVVLVSCGTPETPTADTASSATTTSATATTATQADHGRVAKPGHFKFWKVRSPILIGEVVTLDSPALGSWKARVEKLEYVGNPAEKKHSETPQAITDTCLHYVAYSLDPVDKSRPSLRPVDFKNQFTTGAAWTPTLAAAPWLLVPASKIHGDAFPPLPPPADHFVCFTITPNTPAPIAKVTVTDQFYSDGEKAQLTLTPARICTSVRKLREDRDTEEIRNGKTILAIYDIKPREQYSGKVRITDQFTKPEHRRLEFHHSEYLAVPSEPPR